MADDPKNDKQPQHEPEGLGEHKHGPASEAAHEQGWDINEEERTKLPEGRPAYYGGKGFDYGPRDFGDTPRSTEDTDSESENENPQSDRKAS